ncbi:MAG: hypothetical protein J6R71_05580, partial [Bacteroidales bacterium]|nr:hypothetical protein [Bacteroidales bacterium]
RTAAPAAVLGSVTYFSTLPSPRPLPPPHFIHSDKASLLKLFLANFAPGELRRPLRRSAWSRTSCTRWSDLLKQNFFKKFNPKGIN